MQEGSDALDQYITALDDLSDASDDTPMPGAPATEALLEQELVNEKSVHRQAFSARLCCMKVAASLGATWPRTRSWTSPRKRSLAWQIRNKCWFKINVTRAKALVKTWVAFQDIQSTFSGSKFQRGNCNKIEEMHRLGTIEEEYKTTRDNVAQIMMCKSLIMPISGKTPEKVGMKSLTITEALKAEVGMKLRGIATSTVPTAFDRWDKRGRTSNT